MKRTRLQPYFHTPSESPLFKADLRDVKKIIGANIYFCIRQGKKCHFICYTNRLGSKTTNQLLHETRQHFQQNCENL